MKKMNSMAILLSACLVFSGCGMNNTAKGGLIGAGSGAALGALVGGIAGHGKGAAIGAAVGAAVGTGAGVLIGKKMDKAAAQAEQIEGAQVEQVTDNNGLQAVKVTFDSGILFNTSSATLSTSAKSALSKFANNVLNQNKDMDVAIYGYTDNTGWKNSTAEQSRQKNLDLSQERAKAYVECIKRVGIEEQAAPKDYYIIKSKIEFRDEETGSSIIVLPDDKFSVNTLISYDSKILTNQYATLENMECFPTEIASARTFVFVREIEPLLNAGLIKGGDLDNAIVIYEKQMTQENFDKLADVMGVPHMDASHLGYINHIPLVWPNEPARHKLLDIIGDLALVGKPIKGRIIATRPGHTINNKFARQLRKEIRMHEIQAPVYNCNEEPLMDVNRIRELLPHRYPFQLVDKVIAIGANYIVGVKNVTSNEPFFQGHFPQEPVMPGVLQIEAMAQVGGLLVLNSVDEPEKYSTYFLKIDNVKFRQKVVPGDTLIFRVELMAPIRRGISTMKGYVFVGEKIVCEAEFMAQIVKNK